MTRLGLICRASSSWFPSLKQRTKSLRDHRANKKRSKLRLPLRRSRSSRTMSKTILRICLTMLSASSTRTLRKSKVTRTRRLKKERGSILSKRVSLVRIEILALMTYLSCAMYGSIGKGYTWVQRLYSDHIHSNYLP